MKFWLKKKVLIFFLLSITFTLGGFFVTSSLSASTLPKNISYQGYLTNGAGTAQTGSAPMTIRIYDAPTGGNLLFEELEGTLPITNGFFSLSIGSVGDVNVTTSAVAITDLTFSQPYYITVELGAPYNTGEMTLSGGVRSQIGVAPYSTVAYGVVATTTATGLINAKGKLYYDTTFNQLYVNNGTTWDALGVAGAGITTLNGLSGLSQFFAVSSDGTDVTASSSGSTHTFYIPNAGANSRGVISTTTQTIAGEKTFTSTTTLATTTVTALTTLVATSGSLFATSLDSTNSTSTNGFFSFLTASVANLTGINVTNSTTTTSTSTNLYTTNASISNLNVQEATSTSLFSNLLTVITSTINTLTGGSIVATSSLTSNGTLTVLGQTTLGNASSSNLTTGTLNATGTSVLATTTITTANISDLSSASATLTNLNNTNATSSNFFTSILNAVGASFTNATSTASFFTALLRATDGIFTSSLTSNGTLNVTGLTTLASSTISKLQVTGELRDSLNATGTIGQVLATNGTSTYWTTISGTVADGTSNNQTLYWNGSGWTANSNFAVDANGNATTTGNLKVAGQSTLATTTISALNVTSATSTNLTATYASTTYSSSTALTANTLYATISNLGTITAGNITAGTYNGQTISSTANFTGTLNVAEASTFATTSISQLFTTGNLNASGTLAVTGVASFFNKVGIGTTTPLYDFVSASATSSFRNIIPETTLTYNLGASSTRFNETWTNTLNLGSSTWSLTQSSSSRFSIFDAPSGTGNERISILSNGSVGIGTTTPNQLLSVAGSVGVTGQATFTTASATALTVSGTTMLGVASSSAFTATNLYSTTANLGAITATSITTSNTATSTIAGSINLTSGCFALNGICIATSTGANSTIFSNSNSSVVNGSYLDVTHNLGTNNLLTTAWSYISALGQYGQAAETNPSIATNNQTNITYTTEASYAQENMAYSTTVTPSATTGSNITLTLGSGNWNTDSRVKPGCKIVGNGGEALFDTVPTAQTTITASTTISFTNTNAITSGSWSLFCTSVSNNVGKLNPGLNVMSSGTTTFSYTGSNQTYMVPLGITNVSVKSWGAGGGSGYSGGSGGGGGYAASSTFTVNPGETLTIVVGQGGRINGTNAYGGGGSAINGWGGGGGRSAIMRSSTDIFVAGAGGGSNAENGCGSAAGGPGGGSTGGAGGNSGGTGGGGGTQVSGGAAGSSDAGNGGVGSLKTGGNASSGAYPGGGGGGGYYGGGGGGGGTVSCGSSGGGGSGYVPGGTNTQASGATAANTSDPDWSAGIGAGGNSAVGGNGKLLIYNATGTAIIYATNTPYTILTSADTPTTSGWADITSVAITETLNSQTIRYSVSFDGGTTFTKYDTTSTSTGWRPIARNNTGTWQYNSNTAPGYANVTWTNSTANAKEAAISQATTISANQMTGSQVNAITDTQWNATGGFVYGQTGSINFASTLSTTDSGVTPTVDNILVNWVSTGYKTVQVDTNTTRLYNYTGATQDLKLTVAGGTGNNGGITGSGLVGQIGFFNSTTGVTGSNNFTWDNINSRLGIGTSSPISTLSVQGAAGTNPLTISSSTGDSLFTILQNGNVGVGTAVPTALLSVMASSTQATAPFISFNSTTSQIFNVLTNGNVGIGTSTPFSSLTIQAKATINPLTIASSTGLVLLVVSADGSVGVNTSSPNRKFEVLEANSTPQLRLSKSGVTYIDLSADSVGDLQFITTGGDIMAKQENLWICDGGSCPNWTTGTATTTTAGNVFIENGLYFWNGFSISASTTLSNTLEMRDHTGQTVILFDEVQ